MPLKIIPDHDKPSVAIEIPLEKSLPDYDLHDLELPTPRDVDGVLVSQGFRDLVDDTRGVLLEILCARRKTLAEQGNHLTEMELTPETPHPLEISQLTGAICTQEESHRPGLWIVLRDNHAPQNQALSPALLERVQHYVDELVKRMDLVV
jgi:hypothetical protein